MALWPTGACTTTTTTRRVAGRRESWENPAELSALVARLRLVQIEHNDALKVLRSRDTPSAFHYVDPPYVGSDQGHYKGYTEVHFAALLDCLASLKGKFLLSCYDVPLLRQYAEAHGWTVETHQQVLSAQKVKHGGPRKQKTEVLMRNYTL
ncbi:MAG: DNA adenine methylase [Bacteroidetes bacterium]|nr:DNA adenine methylase [Bacteroidota bacterium]